MVRQVIERPLVRPPRRRMTYEEWRAWTEEDIHSEWVDGEVIEFMSVTPLHQEVLGLFYTLLVLYVSRFNLGKVYSAGLEMRITESAREPDVVFVAKEHLNRIEATRLYGPADLVAEVISDDSVSRDKVDKFAEYAAGGVPEYWLFDPRGRHPWAKLYRRNNKGAYEEVAPDAAGRLHSTVVPGFWIRPEWFWQEPIPDRQLLLNEIIGARGASDAKQD